MQDKKTQSQRRRLNGIVVSGKMEKTIVVKVERAVVHPKYQKRYLQTKKYLVHDESGNHKIGDKVIIEETRPLSKNKRWRVVEETVK